MTVSKNSEPVKCFDLSGQQIALTDLLEEVTDDQESFVLNELLLNVNGALQEFTNQAHQSGAKVKQTHAGSVPKKGLIFSVQTHHMVKSTPPVFAFSWVKSN